MKMTKRVLSIMLALLLGLTLSAPAFAANPDSPTAITAIAAQEDDGDGEEPGEAEEPGDEDEDEDEEMTKLDMLWISIMAFVWSLILMPLYALSLPIPQATVGVFALHFVASLLTGGLISRVFFD